MIDAQELVTLSPQVVAEKVTQHLKACHPGGVTIEVVLEGIVRGEFEWRVPVRPSREPPRPMEYYEAITDVEMELDEREHLNVFLVPSDPKRSQSEETEPSIDAKGPLPSLPADKPERRPKAVKRTIGRKAGETRLAPKQPEES